MLQIFKNRNFLWLFLANFTSQLGSVVGMTAFMLYLLRKFSNQPSYATITELMYTLPMLFLFFLVGVFADRLNRKKIAMYCDYISAFLSVVLLITIMQDWIFLSFCILFLRSGVSKFFQPAQSSLLQGILTEDQYATSAGLNQLVSSLFMLFGGAIGTIVFWKMGVEAAIIIDTISFILSGLLIQVAKLSKEITNPNGHHTLKDLKFTLVLKDFKEGIVYILNHSLLRSLLSGFFLFGVINGGFSVMPSFILKYKLAPDNYEELLIYIGVAFGTGVLLGSIVGSMLAKKMQLQNMIIIGLIISGLCVIAGGFSTSPLAYILWQFIIGLILPIVNIGIGGWFPKIVEKRMMGRVQGWIQPIILLSQSITLGLIALFYPAILKIEWLHAIVGLSLSIVGVYYFVVLPKYMKTDMSNAAVETERSVSQ
ncbi:MFS transporter [Gottfriedia solisilvae]|uniref:Putative MFS-type transporter YkuC n=1 Tax=Gottfriedia solisilvae TaxID=1516104 RepID=A0A8J3AQ96_9BACI|nr:MFS transporter [Gottfriedia solisilvae]GGI16734.1 putative MFS-type transporter YkuC [Gottfriedia solisilvae]